MSDFAARVDSFLGEYFALHPLTATSAGMHAHDAEWPDVTEAGRTRRLEFYEELACPPSLEAFKVILNDSLSSGFFSSTTSLTRILSLTFFGLSSPMITFFPLAPLACSGRMSTFAYERRRELRQLAT